MGWERVASRDAVPPGKVVQVAAGGRRLALYNVAGSLYATDDRCTHAEASLSDGFLEGDEIECPLHQGRFHVPTGRALCFPATEDVETFPVRVEGDAVLVRVSDE
jgi:nitrite reductase/ring-hydroxylating ferredoxin subunit